MAGIAPKICVVLVPLWSLKKIGDEGGGRGRMQISRNIQKT